MATDPFIPKKQGDLLFHEDWNELQARIQNYRPTGPFDGSAYFVNGSLGFNRIPADGNLPVGCDPKGGRYQLTPRPDRLTLESYNSAGEPSGGLSILAANGNVGIGTHKPATPLDVAGANGIRTRLHSGAANWAGFRSDDQNTFIETSTVNAGKWPQHLILSPAGNVGIGTATPAGKLDVSGDIRAGNSDLYFTKIDHKHTGIGNTAGFAAIENASNYDALMILGRAGTPKGRNVRLWDYLQVNGGMDVTGNVGIGTADPIGKLHVSGKPVGANPIMQDKNDRPSISLTGHYPQVVLMSQVANGNHGPTLMLGSYDSGSSTNMKHWSIGTSGQDSTFLDIGYHAGTDNNPHAGIRNHNGTTMMTFLSNGNVGIGTTKPSRLLHVEGDMYVKGQVKEGSSRRIKKNIEPLGETEAIAILEGLETVRYEYAGFGDGRPHLGFIAEDVPDAVAAADRSSLCALEITAVLARTVKALQRKVEELEQRLAVVRVG